ncbi:uncharacterized protein F5891DRAFT_940689 [Suillus fuscotomentosus]|uniref:CCHC-type domain-containing protein n=1 Tax=Suillus fuscotomentosus TaxID=1912939 RepID=A0AAD4HRC0_9AGAM|nr:uncharacterized protein F5891DRAFT_940689 [Suillus fuscotomentosus]KAG1907245.1 hypothetical protein F5891DRAFT_940689 [Suillus fuscotomentosus]
MAYQFSRKGCFKCGNCKFFLRHRSSFVQSNVIPVGHIAENCSSEQRLCYNCRQPGHESSACPSPRTVAAKQCYSCGGVGHIQAECPNLRVQSGNQKCYNCGRFGHIARVCTSGATGVSGAGTGVGFASRAPPPGRALNTSTLPPVKCYRCGGPNHMARDCLAAPGSTLADGTSGMTKSKTCYKCSQEGHVRLICLFSCFFQYLICSPEDRKRLPRECRVVCDMNCLVVQFLKVLRDRLLPLPYMYAMFILQLTYLDIF